MSEEPVAGARAGQGAATSVRARLRERHRSARCLSLLVPKVEAQQMKAKRDTEPGRPLNQVLLGEDVERAGITSMSVAVGSAHAPLDVVLRQAAVGQFVANNHAQGIVVHVTFPGDVRGTKPNAPSLDASRRQPEKAKV
jgi:hypothetical protein